MKALSPLALLLALAGCAGTTTGVSGDCVDTTCAHGTTGGRGGTGRGANGGTTDSRGSSGGTFGSSGTSGGATGSASSGGTAGSSGSNGSSGGVGNPCARAILPDGGGCPNGAFVSDVVDTLSCAPIAGATVEALDANAVPVPGAVTTVADGTCVLCGPSGSAFTPMVTATNYPTWYTAEVQAGFYDYSAITSLISNNVVQAIGGLAPGKFDTALGTIIGDVYAGPQCTDPSGWTLGLTYPDGGAIPDGGYRQVYLGTSELPDPSLTATSALAIAVFYDVDLSVTNFFALTSSKPDAGNCVMIPSSTLGYTGRLYVTANAVSFDILQLP